MPTPKHQKGFTLLEIMVTVAIVGVLGAIAIPIYNNYITKTRIADALTHGRVYAGKVTIDKEDVVEAPSDLEYSAISLAGSQEDPRVRFKLKDTIDSTVLMNPDDRAGGKVIVLSEESSDASVQWACTTNLPQALIPEGCTHEEGVKDRKLLEEWAEGKGDACWSRERAAAGKSGWAAGACTSCDQTGTQGIAKTENPPGPAKVHGATWSGQYIDPETLAKIEAAEEEAAKVAEAARLAEEEAARLAEEEEAARLAEEAAAAEAAAAIKPHTRWDALTPEQQANNTVCFNYSTWVAGGGYGGGRGHGWVAGANTLVEGRPCISCMDNQEYLKYLVPKRDAIPPWEGGGDWCKTQY